MKICPECAFANEERFPACLWCNTVLTEVRSTPARDPGHPEHARQRLLGERHSRLRGQRCFAAACYVALVVFLTILPGGIADPQVLACFAAPAALVSFAVLGDCLGPLSAMFVQGVFSTAVLIAFGRGGVFTGFMLVGHVVLPAVFCYWVELIDGAYR